MSQISILKNKTTGEQYFPQTKFEAILDAGEKIPTLAQLESLVERNAENKEAINGLNANNSVWSSWNSTGVNLLGNAVINSSVDDYPMIRTKKIGSQTAVQLSFNIKNLVSANTAYIQIPVANIPEKNALFNFFTKAGNDLGIWRIDETGKVILINNLKATYDAATNYNVVAEWQAKI